MSRIYAAKMAHAWAHQTKPEWVLKSSNVFFRGSKIYSYGEHFCMGRILPSGVVVLATRTYSATTSSHQADVRSAVSHMRQVRCYDPDSDAESNMCVARRKVSESLAASTKPRIKELTRLQARLLAYNEAKEANDYLDALPAAESAGVEKIVLEALALTLEEHDRIGVLLEEASLKREERWASRSARYAEQRAKDQLKVEERLALWRRNEYSGVFSHITALRLSKDGTNVETSRGADIPVSHAKRLWPLIENVRMLGKELVREFHLGHYNLSRIEADGSIVVGCHQIPYSEIEGIARQLGLLEKEEA